MKDKNQNHKKNKKSNKIKPRNNEFKIITTNKKSTIKN